MAPPGSPPRMSNYLMFQPSGFLILMVIPHLLLQIFMPIDCSLLLSSRLLAPIFSQMSIQSESREIEEEVRV